MVEGGVPEHAIQLQVVSCHLLMHAKVGHPSKRRHLAQALLHSNRLRVGHGAKVTTGPTNNFVYGIGDTFILTTWSWTQK